MVLAGPRMIRGTVTAEHEAVIRIAVRGTRGRRIELDAVVDTGFTGHLTLPLEIVKRLGLVFAGPTEATLGDGSHAAFSVYEAEVLWQGSRHPIGVLAADGGPL